MQQGTESKKRRWDVGMSTLSNNEAVKRQPVVTTLITNCLKTARATEGMKAGNDSPHVSKKIGLICAARCLKVLLKWALTQTGVWAKNCTKGYTSTDQTVREITALQLV